MKDWEAEEAPAVGMAQTCRVVFAARSQGSSRFIKDSRCGYGSIPINTIFRGMNIHKSQRF